MFKAFSFMKRKPGMSRQAFVDYYESTHKVLGEQNLAGKAVSYCRHYLSPLMPGGPEPVYDVVMELCFPDRDSYMRCMSAVAANKDLADMFLQDELRFLDRDSVVHYAVEDQVSVLKT